MFIADGDIRTLSVTEPLGRRQQQLGTLGSGKQIRFGSQLPAGSYWLRIQYKNKTHRAIKRLKAGR
ncbi:hypothetical protein LX87_04462 [Larkinella arboricola]|uniref:Secreted protein (Por secretion system target) n=1 Tax=Larkinella arboricola TaxID=643671 RepID=A0A327WYE4_LARAB|nr:hypothetical protein [Larkinella arboricola]RAJ94575.1 hypothetical protein LX87_04462 [Larkinella arboricola]